MTHILCIETATKVCSVALFRDEQALAWKELDKDKSHATVLNDFIAQVLRQASIDKKDLNAIAVAKGPGSYTGLRIGISTAQAMAFALDIPLISINTLQAMTAFVQAHAADFAHFIPLLDARRMEVFTAVYDAQGQELLPAQPLILDEKESLRKFMSPKTLLFGTGAPKTLEYYKSSSAQLFQDSHSNSARGMGALAWEKYQKKDFEDVAYIEADYLKPFYSKPPKKLL